MPDYGYPGTATFRSEKTYIDPWGRCDVFRAVSGRPQIPHADEPLLIVFVDVMKELAGDLRSMARFSN